MPPTLRKKKYSHRSRAECRDKWKLSVEIAAAIILVVYTFFTILLWRTSQSQLEASERPWLEARITFDEPPRSHSPAPGITFLPDGTAGINAFVVVKNIGHSPASDIYVEARAYPPLFNSGMMTDPPKKARQLCESIKSVKPTNGTNFLFPDRHLPRTDLLI